MHETLCCTHAGIHVSECVLRPVFDCQQRFALIKSTYAHCFHLPDKGGRVTYYERPGMSDFAEMKRVGISKADLLDHYVYCMEYLWQVKYLSSTAAVAVAVAVAVTFASAPAAVVVKLLV